MSELGAFPGLATCTWSTTTASDSVACTAMQPGYQPTDGNEGDGKNSRDLRLPEPTIEVAQQCTAASALAWLRALARGPHMEPAEVGRSSVCTMLLLARARENSALAWKTRTPMCLLPPG